MMLRCDFAALLLLTVWSTYGQVVDKVVTSRDMAEVGYFVWTQQLADDKPTMDKPHTVAQLVLETPTRYLEIPRLGLVGLTHRFWLWQPLAKTEATGKTDANATEGKTVAAHKGPKCAAKDISTLAHISDAMNSVQCTRAPCWLLC